MCIHIYTGMFIYVCIYKNTLYIKLYVTTDGELYNILPDHHSNTMVHSTTNEIGLETECTKL